MGSSASQTQVSFELDPAVNTLTVRREGLNFGGGFSSDAVGIAYVQAAGARGYNSDTYTCTSDTVWIETGIVLILFLH